MKALKQYLPSLGMVLATVLGALYVAVGDNRLTLTEALTLAVSLCGAITTYIVPRLETVQWLKIAVSGVTAALVFAIAALADGSISMADWVQVGIQLLAGLGIVAMTNQHVPVTETIPAPTAPATPTAVVNENVQGDAGGF
jgi:hypothetical protein